MAEVTSITDSTIATAAEIVAIKTAAFVVRRFNRRLYAEDTPRDWFGSSLRGALQAGAAIGGA